MKKLLASLLLMTMTLPVIAATRTVTLSVPGMNCAACPIAGKEAIGKVPGVAKTEVSLDKREATVTFDDARTNVDDLTRATRDAGDPSSPAGIAK